MTRISFSWSVNLAGFRIGGTADIADLTLDIICLFKMRGDSKIGHNKGTELMMRLQKEVDPRTFDPLGGKLLFTVRSNDIKPFLKNRHSIRRKEKSLFLQKIQLCRHGQHGLHTSRDHFLIYF